MQTSIRGLSPQADGFRRHSNTEASVVGSLTNLTQCIPRVSPMRTASGYQAPAVPYHTLICGSLSTPNTALVRKNAEYITNTEHSEKGRLCRRTASVGTAKTQKGTMLIPAEPDSHRPCEACRVLCTASVFTTSSASAHRGRYALTGPR